MASNLLWAHLLRKDATTTTTEPLSQIPPIAPQDKTATSMRMLIHDTQVNLEKFSTRLDGLLQRVDDCRTQVVNANKLLDVERDKVLTEILEIANRCQSEMKVHVGTAAQAPALDLVRVSQVSTERSVQALEKRIDALQALLQTHAHAMQSIQDQQNTLIGAQMDQIKATLSDAVVNAVSAMTKSIEGVRSTLVAEFACGRGRGACSATRVGSSTKSISGSQCKRPHGLSVLGPQEINGHVSSPLDGRSHGGPRLSLKRARVEGVPPHTDKDRFPQKLSRLAVPPTSSGDPLPLLQTPRTPRQPLADLLLLPPGTNTPGVHRHVTSHMIAPASGYLRSPETLSAAGGPSIISTPMSRPPLQPRPNLEDPTFARRRSPAVDRSAIGLPSAAGPSDLNALSKAIKMEDILQPNLTGVFSIHSSPLSSPPTPFPPTIRHDLHETSTNMASTQQELQLLDNMPDAPQVELVQVPPSSSDPLSSNPDGSPPKSMSLRDRRAQISRFGRAETRRFIPLVPWSDEEE